MANPIRILDNGTDISSSVLWKSISALSQMTKDVGTFQFNVSIGSGQTYPAVTVPVVGDTIQLYDSSGLIWAGTVTETEVTTEGLMLTWAITATDWGYYFNGTLVKKNYSQMDPHDIVLDIVANFAAGKGFTTNHVQYGNFLIPSIKFNYQQPSKALQSLANLIGWDWYIDPNKDIHFFLGDVDDGVGEGGVAPIKVDATGGYSGSDIEWNSLDVDLNLTNMQNSVYVIGGTYTKTFTPSTTPDTFLTDGVTQFFSVSYAYEKNTAAYDTTPMVVTLNGVPQTIGTANQDDPADFQVMYNDAQRWIQFTGGAPASGQRVVVYGSAKVPIVAHASDASSVATYGEYQGVITDSKITSVPEAQQRAQAQILQFGHPVYDVKFNTLVPGCRIGQGLLVDLPTFGINETLIIKDITALGYAPGANGMLEYQIEAIGSDVVTFTDLMQSILQQEASQTTVDDSTVTENLVPVTEGITVTDVLNPPTVTSRPYVWSDAPIFQKDTNGTLTKGLVAYYKLEDAGDGWGGYNLTNKNGATFTSGKVNNAVSLVHASSEYLSISSNLGISNGTITMGGWFNFSSLPTTGNLYGLLGHEDNATATGYQLYYRNSSGTYQLIALRSKESNGDQSATYNVTLTTGVWYNFYLLYDGTNIQLFQGATQLATAAASGAGSGGRPTVFNIGCDRASSAGAQFDGQIDEIGVWNKALSTQELTDLNNSGSGQTMTLTTTNVIRWGFFAWQ